MMCAWGEGEAAMRNLWVPLVLGLAACQLGPAGDGGQQGEETSGCGVVASDVLEPGEDSVLGFGGDAISALAAGSHSGTLTWASGSTTGVTVDVGDLGEIRFEDMAWIDDNGSGIEPADDCPDQVAVDATIGLTTEDGAFAESFALPLTASTADEAGFWTELTLDALGGSYTVTEVDPADYDGVAAFVGGTFDESGSHGTIDGQATLDGDASDPEGVASAENFAIATW
jgi:hypothetical protein